MSEPVLRSKQLSATYRPNSLNTKVIRTKSATGNKPRIKPRQDSINALEDHVKCSICEERLQDPKKLTCGHTFCSSCIENKAKNGEIQCPVCKETSKFTSVEDLETDLIITSILKVLNNSAPDEDEIKRCVKCQTICKFHEYICSHCKQCFCSLCWPEHAEELRKKYPDLRAQVMNLHDKLGNKCQEFERKCEQLKHSIQVGTEEKIAELKEQETELLKEVQIIAHAGILDVSTLNCKIADLSNTIKQSDPKTDMEKVDMYMHYHKSISALASEISKFGESKKIFDKTSFQLHDAEDLTEEDDDNFSIDDSYRNREFDSKLIWTKCPKPGGVSTPPWDPHLIYIATLDNKHVLIFDRIRNKVIDKLQHPDMLCPHSVAFNPNTKEIFVSDKWKHCVHVFNQNGTYLRFLGEEKQLQNPRGLAITKNNEIIICDTGKDRVLVLDGSLGRQIAVIGLVGTKTELNMPTDVAVYYEDNKLRVVVVDSGNHRIKVYNEKFNRILEFGTLGKDKGQLKCAETIDIDSSGYIFVGDSGNRRIQVFDKAGQFVRQFSIKDKTLRCISGLHVTQKFEVIVTDYKSKCLYIV